MAIGKFSKLKVIEGIHKGKKGVCKGFVGQHHLTIEFEDGSLDVILIVYVKKA
jgi:hypothetical protein